MKSVSTIPVLLACALLAASLSHAQTSPSPFDLSSGNYSFTTWAATNPAGTYPPNMRFHRGPSQDPGLTAEPNADYVDAYNGTSGARMNGLGTDGFCWRNTGTNGNLGAAVLALNTTGLSNVYVSWTGGTVAIDATTREYRVRLQYRVGTTGPFTDVPGPVEYTATAPAGHSQDFGPTLLPAAVNNQPVVHLRWKYYYITGSNTRPQLRVGNILVQSGQLPGDGTGSVSVLPDTLNGGTIGPIQMIYRRNTQVSVNGLRCFIPPAFTWSHSLSDISYTNMTAAGSVAGDTITFTNIVFSADSTVITIANVTAPDSTALYPFRVQSRENLFADVVPIPRMVVFGAPAPIAEVKANNANGVPLRAGQLVTIEGVVTVANQFGGPSFLQDNSGGMAIFGSSFSTTVNVGDEVKVSGIVSPFNGLSELTNPFLHAIVSSGNTVTPLSATCFQLFNDGQGGVEQFEGLLVRVNLVHMIDTVSGTPPSQWNQCGISSGCNYRLIDGTGYVDIRADNDANFFSSLAPQGTFSVIGVLSQFKAAAPFIGGYQLMPRSSSDLLTSGPIIATPPVESGIQQNAVTINWTTFSPGTTRLRYGLTTNYESGVLGAHGDTTATSHAITITGLTPATAYNVQAFSVAGSDTSVASNIVVSTASPSQSTGMINAYFNKSVRTSIAWFQNANGNENLVARVVTRMNNARRSIDAALYSLSGFPGDQIAQVLVNARNRGVKVRVICEYDNASSNAYTFLVNNGIPLITDRFDPINLGAGLHHNKFFVFDARGGAPESVWVWTGSWNPTDPGTNSDYQNSIEIQDAALANAYTLEFNEMWGSATDVPNAQMSRFGVRKMDNTPHRFIIGGRPVECYFSPSDRATSKILTAFAAADHSIAFNIYTFTRADLATTIIARKNAGKKVRGVMDNNTDTGSQYGYLVANNVDVRLKTGSGLLHHKVGLVDAEYPYWNSLTITGSHNWSNSAENSNNENTLFVYDGNITNQYLQEFAARYYQFGGTDTILVSMDGSDGSRPREFSLSQNYPNPFNPTTVISFQVPVSSRMSLKVYNVLGQEVATLVNGVMDPGTYNVQWDARDLASGVYFSRLQATPANGGVSFMTLRKMIMVK